MGVDHDTCNTYMSAALTSCAGYRGTVPNPQGGTHGCRAAGSGCQPCSCGPQSTTGAGAPGILNVVLYMYK